MFSKGLAAILRRCAFAALAFFVCGPAAADAVHSLTQEDLGAFFDGIIPLQLERSDIAGATVLVMKDGVTLLQKGYGFSDVKAKQPVDATTTLFRLASISKLFTWMTVMQLVEQGKLDLDVGIDRYLDFPVHTLGGASHPLTLRNLMTHTSGFEETGRNIIVTDPKYYASLRDYLIQNQPRPLFVPGTVPAYSNYAVGLGSYIVQRVSAERFEDYVAAHVFAPLGMTHSTLLQPPPASLEKLPSQGYPSSTRAPPIGFERFSPAGAGGLSSTAADMGRFGLALLNGGELDGHRVLQPQSLAAMWKPQFSASDQLPPIGLGFYQVWRNQLRWIGHQGDLVAFHSLFFVEPQQKLVVFISYNSAGSASKARPEFLNAFSDRYFPAETSAAFLNESRSSLLPIEGIYQPSRRADSTPLKLAALTSQAHAKLDKDGVLHVDKMKDLRGHSYGWKPIGKDLWQQVGDQNKLFAIRGADGSIERLAGAFAAGQWQRVVWYERDHLVFSLLGGSLLVSLCVLFAALLRITRRYILRSTQPIAAPNRVALSTLPKVAAIYWILFFAALCVLLSIGMDDNSTPPTAAWDTYFLIGDIFCVIAILLSLFALLAAVGIWRRRGISRLSQVKFTLVGCACVVLSWFVIHWNVLAPLHRL